MNLWFDCAAQSVHKKTSISFAEKRICHCGACRLSFSKHLTHLLSFDEPTWARKRGRENERSAIWTDCSWASGLSSFQKTHEKNLISIRWNHEIIIIGCHQDWCLLRRPFNIPQKHKHRYWAAPIFVLSVEYFCGSRVESNRVESSRRASTVCRYRTADRSLWILSLQIAAHHHYDCVAPEVGWWVPWTSSSDILGHEQSKR